jgi:diguanylate cyclase (GGDEF)-like protein
LALPAKNTTLSLELPAECGLQGNFECKRSKRYGYPLALLMIDIDYFKKVNDSYSHDVGDQVLKHVALLLRSVLRESDLLGRLGGEEFAVLLPNIDRTRAYQLAERLRCLVEESLYTTLIS